MEKVYIAIITVTLSGLLAYIIALRKIRSEMTKFKMEIIETYASKLFEARMNTYPPLYAILSEYAKQIYYGKANKTSAKEFHKDLDDWNNKSGILLGKASYHVSSRIRKLLNELIEHRANFSDDDFRMIKKAISAFELSLRYEIGVHNIDAIGRYPEYETDSAEISEYASSIRELNINKTPKN